jgi:hypothetical protein
MGASVFSRPDPRNVRHQQYCAKSACRKAAKAASQGRWLAQPENQDYFRGPENVARVQAWRQAHPRYGRDGGVKMPLRYKMTATRKQLNLKGIHPFLCRRRYKMSYRHNPLPHAAMLYLFLVTVADAQGLSWYTNESITRRLWMDCARLRRARDDLVRVGLIAWARPVYQVLALDRTPTSPSSSSVATSRIGKEDVHERIAQLRAVVGKRP